MTKKGGHVGAWVDSKQEVRGRGLLEKASLKNTDVLKSKETKNTTVYHPPTDQTPIHVKRHSTVFT